MRHARPLIRAVPFLLIASAALLGGCTKEGTVSDPKPAESNFPGSGNGGLGQADRPDSPLARHDIQVRETPSPAPGGYTPLAVNSPAPDFTLPNPEGRPVRLEDYTGKIVVLEWVNWDCPFARRVHANEYVNTLSDYYARDGVVWLTIDSTFQASPEREQQMAARYHATFPVLADPQGQVARQYHVPVTPYVVVLDKQHRIAYQGPMHADLTGHHHGGHAEREKLAHLEQALEKIVLGKPVERPVVTPSGTPLRD